MQIISQSISTVYKGSGSYTIALNKEYCKALNVVGGKGCKIKQSLVVDGGKCKVLIEAVDSDDRPLVKKLGIKSKK